MALNTDAINVYNRNKFDIGIKRPDGSSMNIRHGSFDIFSENEINWLMSMCDIFARGLLQLDEEYQYLITRMGIDPKESVHAMTDEEIKTRLSASAKKIEEWLKDINDPIAIDKICKVADTMDLNKSKLQIIKDKVPDRDVLE